MINPFEIYKKILISSFEWEAWRDREEESVPKTPEKQESQIDIDLNSLSEEDKRKLEELNLEISKVKKKLEENEASIKYYWGSEKVYSQELDSELSGEEKIRTPETQEIMDKVYELKRKLNQLEEEKFHLLRSIEVWKSNKLDMKEIDEMKGIKPNEFLRKIDPKKRLRYITKSNVEAEQISEDWVKELDFTFTYWDVFNKELYIMTTAWQVLPENVRVVNVWWEEYSRKWINWEFFTQSWRRLTIHEWTNLTITEFWDVDKLYEDFEKDLEKYKDTPDYELAYEAKKKWYNPDFVVSWLWEFVKDKKDKTEIEELLTDIARHENAFNESYPSENWTIKAWEITDKFAWYLLNAFWAKEETFQKVSKEFKFDLKVLRETKASSDIWWWKIKNMEDINIEWVSKEEIDAILKMNRFRPRSKEAQILFRVALQASGLPESWYNSPALHNILERESNWKVWVLNYTINWMDTNYFKNRALSYPHNDNPIGSKSTASWLWQLLLSNVDKYYPDWRNWIWNPVSEAVWFIRYIVDRYGTPEIAWSVYGKVASYNHPTKWRQHKWFKEWY